MAAMGVPELDAGPDILRHLFERRYQAMVHAAELLLGDRAAAEDVTQDAFARLAVRIGRLSEPESADGYLRVMVVNLSRSALRHRRVANRYAEQSATREPSEEDASDAMTEHQAAIAALRRLSRRQRECLVLRYYLDMAEGDVAATLGISAGSVKTHCSRGLSALSKLLGGGSDE